MKSPNFKIFEIFPPSLNLTSKTTLSPQPTTMSSVHNSVWTRNAITTKYNSFQEMTKPSFWKDVLFAGTGIYPFKVRKFCFFKTILAIIY